MMTYWVYVLHCQDGSFYTGHTDDLERRFAEHSSGAFTQSYTFRRRPLKLVYSQEFGARDEAFAAERQIKGWSRAKKAALIDGDIERLSYLALPKSRPRQPATSRPQCESGVHLGL